MKNYPKKTTKNIKKLDKIRNRPRRPCKCQEKLYLAKKHFCFFGKLFYHFPFKK